MVIISIYCYCTLIIALQNRRDILTGPYSSLNYHCLLLLELERDTYLLRHLPSTINYTNYTTCVKQPHVASMGLYNLLLIPTGPVLVVKSKLKVFGLLALIAEWLFPYFLPVVALKSKCFSEDLLGSTNSTDIGTIC